MPKLSPISAGLLAVGIVLLVVIVVMSVLFAGAASTQKKNKARRDAQDIAISSQNTAIVSLVTGQNDLRTVVSAQAGKIDLMQMRDDETDMNIHFLKTTDMYEVERVNTLSSAQAASTARLGEVAADQSKESRGTALVFGNNGSASCPFFCNATATFGIASQIPSYPSWRGATAMRASAMNGFCDCVEDPTHPFNTITDPQSNQVYRIPSFAPASSPATA